MYKKRITVLILLIMLVIQVNAHAEVYFIEPLDIDYYITSDYGLRVHPVTGEESFHYGIDLGVPVGSPVLAVEDGTILTVGYQADGAGNYVTIEHSDGYLTKYFHLDSYIVAEGEAVSKGQIIGYSGNTGTSTGPHLHFEVWLNGESVDPKSVIVFDGLGVSFIDARAVQHETGGINMRFTGYAPFRVYKSVDNQNYTFMAEVQGNLYTEYGLNPGTTYYYKIIDGNNSEIVVKYTVPFTVIQITPLRVVDIGDEYVHLEWSQFQGEVDLYDNGELIASGITDSSYTVTDLEPYTIHRFTIMNDIGYVSNTVRVRTTKKFLDLEKMFFPDNITDTDGDGIPDTYDKLYESWERLTSYSPIRVGDSTKAIYEQEYSGFDSSAVEFPALEITYAEGLTFNIFDLSRFNEIVLPIVNKTVLEEVRAFLAAIIWIEVFIYFTARLIPHMKV